MSDTTEKPNYKKTLNLPKTQFPMRANLSQNEPLSIKRWEKEQTYAQVIENRKDAPRFVFHDGPPYANGNIHVGHLLNKVLKDMVVRSQNLIGKQCAFVPGWDCHGLPIEHKVVTEMIAENKDAFSGMSQAERHMTIRKACQKYASNYIKLQSKQMKRLLTMADYDKPYLTMQRQYEKEVLHVFSGLVKEGLVFRQLKPVHWSIANQTALAEAELEYEDKEDISVYVNFPAVNAKRVLEKFGVTTEKPVSFTIWTTTPWTLPANLAVAIHEGYTYSLLESDESLIVIAEELIESLEKITKKTFKKLGNCKGKDLLGESYQHPFCNRTGNVVHADYVTLEDGTGLVHTAPGHGIEDYQTGLREGLDIYCPVQGDGCYDNTVPDWLKGKLIWNANTEIVSHLQSTGHLLTQHKFMHSYPHDWRSKTPVIFRSTEQWFIGVDTPLKSNQKTLRSMALNAIASDIDFHPKWGQNRFRGMLESRPDWCISRQRAWGLPIPAFRTKEGEILLTEASVNAVGDVFAKEGSDAWFIKSPAELLATYESSADPEAPQNLDISSLEKMMDIFDVWFESGTSWHAVLESRGLGFPADLYLEGSDQHRGWFHLSLLPALGLHQKAPYKALLTHGFIVDKDGRKMSKSQGNALDVETLLETYGAEVARWWVSSLTFENDIKVDLSYFDVAGESYRKIRNTIRFLLSALEENPDPVPSKFVETLSQTSLEGYLLEKTAMLSAQVKTAYTEYKFKQAHTLIYQFCNDTLSSFYCTAIKDRLYCDRLTSPRRIQTQHAIQVILHNLLLLLAPILPHTADEAFAFLSPTEGTIHLQSLPTLSFKADPDWDLVLEWRDKSLKQLELAKEAGIENALDAGISLPKTAHSLKKFESDLADIFGVSQVHFSENEDISVLDLRNEPRCERSWRRDGTVKQRPDGGLLSDRDFEAVQP